MIVNEGTDARLVCKAHGHPEPRIKWLREDKRNFSVYSDFKKQTYQTGRNEIKNQSMIFSYFVDNLDNDRKNWKHIYILYIN